MPLTPGQGILKGTLFTPPNTHPVTTIASNRCQSNVMEEVPSAFQRLISLCVLVPPSTPFLNSFTTLNICPYLCLLFQSYPETGSFSSSVKYDGSPGGSDGKESTGNAGDLGSIPGLGRCPGGGHGNPFQCSWLEHPMDRGAWWATVHGVTKSRTPLSN